MSTDVQRKTPGTELDTFCYMLFHMVILFRIHLPFDTLSPSVLYVRRNLLRHAPFVPLILCLYKVSSRIHLRKQYWPTIGHDWSFLTHVTNAFSFWVSKTQKRKIVNGIVCYEISQLIVSILTPLSRSLLTERAHRTGRVLPTYLSFLLSQLVLRNQAAYEPSRQTHSVILYWRTAEEWGDILHNWVSLIENSYPLVLILYYCEGDSYWPT